MQVIDVLQDSLNFSGCSNLGQFSKDGLGKIGTTGFLIGLVGGVHFGIGLTLLIISPVNMTRGVFVTMVTWCVYMTVLCTFHFLEFFATAVKQPKVLNYDSYIVNHSKAYTIALLCGWSEYWLEIWLFGSRWKWLYFTVISIVGLIFVLVGQVIRTMAMWHCGEHFAHIIMHQRTPEHQLVTTGIYSILRHPAYFGWFYWSIGTQLLLCNPVCACAYGYTAWMFFADRIPYEERLLFQFYGAEYVKYAQRTHIGIPYIASPLLKEKQQMNESESLLRSQQR